MSILFKFLIQKGYKSIERQNFHEKINELFGFENPNKETFILHHPKGYELNLKEKFINTLEFEHSFIQEMEIFESNMFNEENDCFIWYNKIIFNDDINSIIQILQNKQMVEDLVVYFDYEKSSILLNYALNNINFDNVEILYLEHLVFYNNRRKENVLKVNFILKILEKNELFFIKIVQSLIEFWNSFIIENNFKYKAIAFMIEELLKKNEKNNVSLQDNSAFLLLNNSYVEKEELQHFFLKENYYNYSLLEKYSELYILLNKEKEELIINPIKDSKLVILLYGRPDFNSFSKEITVAEEDIEYISKISGWDYIKLKNKVGYLPPQDIQESQMAKRKHSFLADEESLPEKKKGFWSWFG